jgi:hypothetical protein
MTIQPIKPPVFKQTPAEERKPIAYFKYNPVKKLLVIECQPIRPYGMIDQLNVDKFCKQEDKENAIL